MEKNEKIILGSYPYTEKGEKRPIEWQVLQVSEDSALLLSVYALDAQPKFQKSSCAENEQEEKAEETPGFFRITEEQKRLLDAPYEQSWLHDWLNHDFLQQAFTDQERSLLLEAEDSTHPGPGNLGRVFVLCKSDIDDAGMFPADLSTGCTATPYAKTKYDDDIERNRQEEADRPYAERASYWLRDSPFVVWGGNAGARGVICMRLVLTDPLAVRPAVLIDRKAYEKAGHTGFSGWPFDRKTEAKPEQVPLQPISAMDISVNDRKAGRVLLIEKATAYRGAKLLFIPVGINQQPVELVSKPGISEEHVRALMACFASACAGSDTMQMTLGSLYWSGTDVPQSYEQSVRWDCYAANQGNAAAMTDLAECYNKGLGGLPKNDRKAFELTRKAAEAGNVIGMKNLAACYAHGIGVDADRKQADIWAAKAADAEAQKK